MRYKCTVAYEGAAYCGWQRQKNGRSVQGVVEDALAGISNEGIRITGAGRTDAGVNAAGQVFHFDSRMELSAAKWRGAINSRLPEDIRIVSVEAVDDQFHARYGVRRKQYDYRIHTGGYDVFSRNTAYQCPYPIDVERMKDAAEVFIGRHDFAAFCSNSFAETPDQVRTVESIRFLEEGNLLTVSYTGAGFLRYMVRMMAGALLECGRGRLSKEEIRSLLEGKSKDTMRWNAPACGLTLVKIDYFRILAADRDTLIRETVPEDNVPEKYRYVFLQKKTQQVLGWIADNGVWTVTEEGMPSARALLPVLQQHHPEMLVMIENEH
ncbi:MAG: tRNA pseudouridine(38-40) synthase TruA [Solobacterium sp.]|nr:tRNA pseudouridine(38-40) synthase TruA [Solobacterium sp.]